MARMAPIARLCRRRPTGRVVDIRDISKGNGTMTAAGVQRRKEAEPLQGKHLRAGQAMGISV